MSPERVVGKPYKYNSDTPRPESLAASETRDRHLDWLTRGLPKCSECNNAALIVSRGRTQQNHVSLEHAFPHLDTNDLSMFAGTHLCNICKPSNMSSGIVGVAFAVWGSFCAVSCMRFMLVALFQAIQCCKNMGVNIIVSF